MAHATSGWKGFGRGLFRSWRQMLAVGLTATALAFALWRNPAPQAADEIAGEGTVDADRAFQYLNDVCRIGPRYSGSEGMEEQQKLIAEHFVKFRAKVGFQSFDTPHPQTRQPVRMNNIIVSWNPTAKQRILLCCHYDTLPRPERDLFPNRGTFIGANDGGSGVALFMELAHHMGTLQTPYGVDFVFFDGEELRYQPRDPFFLGSTYFAQQYRDGKFEHEYVYGVLVDMVGDKNLNLYQEKQSLRFAPDLVKSIWGTARRLNIKEFIPRAKHELQDDHLPLNEIAKIPTIDIIDFDYAHWHTSKDIPANCSGESLAKVGRVLLQWMAELPPPK